MTKASQPSGILQGPWVYMGILKDFRGSKDSMGIMWRKKLPSMEHHMQAPLQARVVLRSFSHALVAFAWPCQNVLVSGCADL